MSSFSQLGGALSSSGNGPAETSGDPGEINFGKGNTPKGEEDSTRPQGDPYKGPDAAEKASERIDKLLAVSRFMRPQFERDWFRNLLFFGGIQWIVDDRGKWRMRTLPTWFPRAMTNKFAEKVNDLTSAILQNGRVPINYLPSTDDADDRATAEISDALRNSMYEEADTDEFEEELARWIVVCGNGFLHPYYDKDAKNGGKTLPLLECAACKEISPPDEVDPDKARTEPNNACPKCGEGPLAPAVGDDGQPLTITYPTGRFATKCLSPFEVHIDHRVRRWSDHRRFAWMELVDVDEVKEEISPEMADKIVADDANTDLGMFYLETMAQITSSYGRTSALPGGLVSTASSRQPKTMKYHYYELPTKYYPGGLHAVRIGTSKELVTVIEPLPDTYGAGPRKGQPFLPLTHFGFDVMPGRAWNKTRMDDLIALQMFRNIIDANLRLTVQRMGNSIWLNPKGSGVTLFTGTPGQKIDYNPVSFGGSSFAKPERVPPDLSGVAALVAVLNKIDDAMERIAGTYFLMGGDTPPGVTAASALAYLGERSQKAMSTFARSWAKSWKSWEGMGLEIYRREATAERIVSVVGKNRQWEIKKFTSAELAGGVRMQIDYNGLFPKSQATERATITQLTAAGFVNPGDPEMDAKVLEKFGESDLKPSTDLDEREATKENEEFMEAAGQANIPDIPPKLMQIASAVANGQTPIDPSQVPPELQEAYEGIQDALKQFTQILDFVPIVQNSVIHLRMHTDLCKTEEFKALPDIVKQAMYAHLQVHMHDLESQQAAAAAGGGGGAAGPPQKGGPKGSKPQPGPGPQGPSGTNQIQQVSPDEQPQDLLGAAMEPAEAQSPGPG